MVKAETVYDTLCQKKKWGKKDPRDEQILALQTKVEELSKRKKTSSNNNNSSSSTRKHNNNSSSSSQKKRHYPDWRYEKPKDGKKHLQKDVKGKMIDFWWCDVLEMWARHKPDECKASKKQESTKSTNKGTNNSSNKPRLQVAQATTYAMSDDDEDEERPFLFLFLLILVLPWLMFQALGILESTVNILSLAHFIIHMTIAPPPPSPNLLGIHTSSMTPS